MEQLFVSFSDKEGFCFKAFAAIGAATTSYFLLKMFKKFFYVVKMYGFSSRSDFLKYGSWSGNYYIKSFIKYLCNMHFNLLKFFLKNKILVPLDKRVF